MAFDPISKRPDSRALALLVLGLTPLGCSDPAPEQAPSAVATEVEEAAPVESEPSAEQRAADERAARLAETQLREWLSEQVVTMDEVFRDRPVVYTWTTAEQVEQLRAGGPLLTRSRGSNGEAGAFAGHLAGETHPVARHLRRPSPRRFGWTNPWATRRGWSEGEYGDRLIAVELRADAWVATFDATAEPHDRWRVTDLAGQAVDEGEVAAHPERVAAVLHVGRGVSPAGEPRVAREIVLASERWLARWTVGGDELEARVAADRARLLAFADHLEAEGADLDESAWRDGLSTRWTTATPTDASLTELYDRSLALGSPLVRPDAAQVRALVESLTLPAGPTFTRDLPDPPARRARRPPPRPAAAPPPPRPHTTEIVT